ncbi:MAG: hypothetical protein M1820_002706 [Bogoriella megaspora]|nr:MAG: hypothetical protein M1820_002706 [Bogoriella megaspora]
MASLVLRSSNALKHRIIKLADPSDLTLRTYELDESVSGDHKPAIGIVDFQVDRATVAQDNFSKPLKRMVGEDGRYQEAKKGIVELGEDNPLALDPFLRQLHKFDDHDFTHIDLKIVWLVLHIADKYIIDLRPLKGWFRDWNDKKGTPTFGSLSVEDSLKNMCQILYPAYAFNCAKAFLEATEFVVYHHCYHITESTPLEELNLHLPKEVIQQLNSAKGRVRAVLHRDLFGAISPLLAAECSCKEATFFGYFKEMFELRVFPFETTFKDIHLHTMTHRLRDFSYEAAETACTSCKRNYNAVVSRAASRADGYFDGLCLDCMDASKPKTGDTDDDYWQHNKLKQWDKTCRVNHGQPTWYFSYMGRREDMRKHQKSTGRWGRKAGEDSDSD